MAQTYSLDRVIRRVAKDTRFQAESQRLVAVDVERRAALESSARVWPWTAVQYYLVSNRNNPSHESRVVIPPVPLTDLEERLEVTATLLVSCLPGNEARVAVALFDPAYPPNEVLEQHVILCLRELARDDVGGFARRLCADPAAVERSLTQRLESTTGLSVRLKLSLPSPPAREPVRVEVGHLPVRVRDWDEEQELGFRADLELDEAAHAAAVLTRTRVGELQQLIPDEIRGFLRREVSLAEFPELSASPKKQALVEHLDQVLRPHGRRVGALLLRPGAPPPKPEELSVLEEVVIHCAVPDHPTRVKLENKVLIRVADLVKYRGQGSRELRGWLRETLERLVPEIVFEARYADLLLRFPQWEERIREAVRAAAERIGCEIRQFITEPSLPQAILVRPFVIRTEGAYATLFPDVEARLEVVVTARIPRLDDIAPLLSTTPDIPRAMEEAIRGVVAEWMHGLHPERFYMRFSSTEPSRHGEETRSVEAELVELVKNRLTQGEFHAEVIRTVIKILETDLIRRFRELQDGTPDVSVLVESVDYGEVEFAGDLRVVAVQPDGWNRFRILTGGIERITAKVVDHLHTVLHTLPPEELLFRSEAERDALARKVAAAVRAYGAEQFGLDIRVSNFRRKRTGIENHLLRRQGEVDDHVWSAELVDYGSLVMSMKRLTARRDELFDEEGTEVERARVESDIASVKAMLESARTLSARQLPPPRVREAGTERALPGPAADAAEMGGGES